MEPANRIIAIGSPHGDDQVAWRLIERLGGCGDLPATLVALRDPSGLHGHMDGCDRLVILDACCGAGPPGTVIRLEWPDESIQHRLARGTHGMGVWEVLQLEQELGRLPARVVILAVELSAAQPGGSLSDEVEAALTDLEAQVLQELQDPCASPRS
ncbi:MAG: hydrogenase maturation protease [Planctomycetales bacterium]|nr:hydrogenase maturation protease [Planctomycetales bacterium]